MRADLRAVVVVAKQSPAPPVTGRLLPVSQRTRIITAVSVNERGDTVCHNNPVRPGPLNPVSSHHNTRMMNVIDKIFLLIDPDPAGSDIVNVIIQDMNMV